MKYKDRWKREGVRDFVLKAIYDGYAEKLSMGHNEFEYKIPCDLLLYLFPQLPISGGMILGRKVNVADEFYKLIIKHD